MPKRITVVEESDTGRNERFRDNYNGTSMTRNQFVRKIEKGEYPKYHIRKINDIPLRFLILMNQNEIILIRSKLLKSHSFTMAFLHQ